MHGNGILKTITRSGLSLVLLWFSTAVGRPWIGNAERSWLR